MTFLYELDRSHWPKFQRPFEDYLVRFKALVQSCTNLIVFSDDPRVMDIARDGGAKCIHKRKEDFASWTLESTRAALDKKRMRFHTPEFYSEEYICIQLCKIDAVLEAMSLGVQEHEPVFWIDAGVRGLPESWTPTWTKPNQIHFLKIGPNIFCDYININFPTFHFAGGFWGGAAKDIEWFAQTVKKLSTELLERGQCANDQQIFSMVHRRYPERFWGYESYQVKTPLLFWHFAEFKHLFKILQDSDQGKVTKTIQYHIQVALLALVILYFVIKAFNPTKSA